MHQRESMPRAPRMEKEKRRMLAQTTVVPTSSTTRQAHSRTTKERVLSRERCLVKNTMLRMNKMKARSMSATQRRPGSTMAPNRDKSQDSTNKNQVHLPRASNQTTNLSQVPFTQPIQLSYPYHRHRPHPLYLLHLIQL